MKKCLAAGTLLAVSLALWGANIQPILTGAGKLVFPEASPAANLVASGGTLTISAGGTNKHLVLLPSGASGFVGIQTPTPNATLDVNGSGNFNGMLTVANGNFIVSAPSGAAGVKIVNLTLGGSNAWTWYPVTNGLHSDLRLYDYIAGGDAITVQQGGNTGFGTTPAYRIDAAGDVNASGVFRKGGTAGASGTLSLPSGGSVTYSGGIATAFVSPSSTAVTVQNNVAGTHSLGSVYQNLTGKPLWVNVSASNNTVATSLQVYNDASNPPVTAFLSQAITVTGTPVSVVFPVLPNNYYKVQVSVGTPTVFAWFESY